MAKFLSQRKELSRPSVSTRPFLLGFDMRSRLRIGIFIQAGLSSSYRIMLFLKPLRSIRVTGLLRYFGLLRHPLRFRPSTEWLSHPRAGFPGSSADLSSPAVPFHPGCLAPALARCFITNGRL